MIRDSLERLNFIATDRDGMTRKRNRDRTPTVAAPTDVNIILLSSPPSRNILLFNRTLHTYTYAIHTDCFGAANRGCSWTVIYTSMLHMYLFPYYRNLNKPKYY